MSRLGAKVLLKQVKTKTGGVQRFGNLFKTRTESQLLFNEATFHSNIDMQQNMTHAERTSAALHAHKTRLCLARRTPASAPIHVLNMPPIYLISRLGFHLLAGAPCSVSSGCNLEQVIMGKRSLVVQISTPRPGCHTVGGRPVQAGRLVYFQPVRVVNNRRFVTAFYV